MNNTSENKYEIKYERKYEKKSGSKFGRKYQRKDTGTAKGKKKRKALKIILIIMGVLLALILMAIAALSLTAYGYLDKINKTETAVEDVVAPEEEDFEVDKPEEIDETVPEVDPSSIEWEETESIDGAQLINILLVGQDDSTTTHRTRTDSMILCSINPETKKVSVISFLRDLYVQIPGEYSDNRLNTAFKFGGFELLDATIEQNFGVTVDGNVEVDFDRFIKAVDTIGGVDIRLTAEEAEVIGGGVVEGKNRLNGEQALAYARIRKIDSDFGRTERQRKIIMSVFNKVKSLSIGELQALMEELMPCFTTDMSNEEIVSLGMKILPMLSSMEISTHHVPGEGAYSSARIRDMSVLIPNNKLIKEQLQNEYLPLG